MASGKQIVNWLIVDSETEVKVEGRRKSLCLPDFRPRFDVNRDGDLLIASLKYIQTLALPDVSRSMAFQLSQKCCLLEFRLLNRFLEDETRSYLRLGA